MKVGILSDSHGKTKRLEAAVRMLLDWDAQTLVHCGDIGPTKCVELLGKVNIPVYLVAGNMDRNVEKLEESASNCGIQFDRKSVQVPVGPGTFLAAAHGHDGAVLNGLIVSGKFSYVAHGHTHRIRDEYYDKVRILNPGALYNPDDPRFPTVALLDTTTDVVQYLKIK